MARHNVQLDTLKNCLQFLLGLNTDKKMQNQVSNELHGRLSGKYNTVDQPQIEQALSQFLIAVSNFHNKLCNKAPAVYNGNQDPTAVLDALLECIPKFLAVMYFLRYQVDDGFKALGGGGWKDKPVGGSAIFGGELQAYFTAPSSSKTYGVVPGGFGRLELKSYYRRGSFMTGYLATICEKHADRNIQNYFLDVFATSVLRENSGTQDSNTANALALVRTFCEIVEKETQAGGGELKQKLDDSLNGDTVKKMEVKNLKKEEFAKYTAQWLRDNLGNVKNNLVKIDTTNKALGKKSTAELTDYFTNNLFPYGFTFDKYNFARHKNPYDVLQESWANVINEFNKANNGLAKLKEILEGQKCPGDEGKKLEGAQNQGPQNGPADPASQNNGRSEAKHPPSPVAKSGDPGVQGSQGFPGPGGPGPSQSPDASSKQVVHPQQPSQPPPVLPPPPPPPPLPGGPSSAAPPGPPLQGSSSVDTPAQHPAASPTAVRTQSPDVAGSGSGPAGVQGVGQHGSGGAGQDGGQVVTQDVSRVTTASGAPASGSSGSGETNKNCSNGKPPVELWPYGFKYCPRDSKTWDSIAQKKMHDEWDKKTQEANQRVAERRRQREDRLRQQKEAEERKKQRDLAAQHPIIPAVQYSPPPPTYGIHQSRPPALSPIRDYDVPIIDGFKSTPPDPRDTWLDGADMYDFGGQEVSEEDDPVFAEMGGEPIAGGFDIKLQQEEDSKYKYADQQLQAMYEQRHVALQEQFEADKEQRRQAEAQLHNIVPPDAFEEVMDNVAGEEVIDLDNIKMSNDAYPVVVGVEGEKLPADYDAIHEQQKIANIHDAYTRIYEHRKSEDEKIEAMLHHAQQVGVMNSLNDDAFGELVDIPHNPKSYVPESWIKHYVDRIPKPIPPVIETFPHESRPTEATQEVPDMPAGVSDTKSFTDLQIHVPKRTVTDPSYDFDIDHDPPPLPGVQPLDLVGPSTAAIALNLTPFEVAPYFVPKDFDKSKIKRSNVDMCIPDWSTQKPTHDSTDIPETELFPSEAPRTVKEMLTWIAGLQHKKHQETMKQCIEKAFKRGEDISAILPLSVNGADIRPQHVIDTIQLAATFAASVLNSIAPKWRMAVPSARSTPREPDWCALPCQLRDYVYACCHQLAFLKSQCSRRESDGGWQDCYYGSNVSSPKSPLQAFLTDASDSKFQTYPFDPCDICRKSRINMGFTKDDLPDDEQDGKHISTILSPTCGGDDPLLTLASYLNCLTRRTPRTTGELVSFFHNCGNELHDAFSDKLLPLGSALSSPHYDCPDWDRLEAEDLRAIEDARGSATPNSNHDKNHPKTLSTMLGCDITNAQCPQHLSPITYRAYALYSSSFVHHYLSWAVYLPDRLHESLEKLSVDLRGHDNTKCTSLYACHDALPLLYSHGFTPPDGTLQSSLTCSKAIANLKEVVNGRPIASLMTAMDNFLYRVREPFIYTVFTLWSVAMIFLAHTMLYRMDILRIRSHLLTTRASHLIDVKALLTKGRKMLSLYKGVDYFDDESAGLLHR
ncbi:Ribosome-binding protein 1 [Babesia ovata]|uniref:Ribosome-binding protein 1 n=1 Tax=Babesia ovata TaxID=189622 RepID=A0A2H6KEG2_9APIC|nr:Ribosome-binding protein 1 [Babesia ovata]GBE61388.1 Ribosome-binding protein 1 [Babesia ovata]